MMLNFYGIFLIGIVMYILIYFLKLLPLKNIYFLKFWNFIFLVKRNFTIFNLDGPLL